MRDDSDLQRRLRHLFLGELEEAVGVLTAGLIRLEEEPDPRAASALVADLFRTAHSVKGAAMSAGVEEAVDAARQLEAGFARLRDEGAAIGATTVQGFLVEVDALEAVAGRLRDTAPDEDHVSESDAGDVVPGGMASDPNTGASDIATKQGVVYGIPTSPRDAPTVRIAPPQVDDLVGRSGDLLATVGRVHDLAAALATAGEQAPPGLPRDVTQAVDRLARSAASVARDVSRVSDGITTAVERLTLQPFKEACEGLDRTVRDLARAAGKHARLVVTGGEIEVDRAVTLMLREPLLHLVRNAVDHGIDSPQQRQAADKPAVGTVTITARLHRGRLEVVVADDGRGVDRTALRRVAQARALELGEDELAVAFHAGVSTAADVTDVSGRGVGLDVVRTRLETIGGTVTMSSTAGAGTIVTLNSPVNLALLRAIIVRIGEEVVVLPMGSVERLVSTAAVTLQQLGGQTVASLDDDTWPVVPLGGLLGMTSAGTPPYLIVVGVGDKVAALAVDELLEDREIVVKPLPHRLDGIRQLLGVTVLSDGRPALVLNPATCVPQAVEVPAPELPVLPIQARRPRRVLVAEDALTTRVLQQRILEGAGYEVTTAVDGAQAWELLQRDGADVVVSDVHMPRMDGIALCQAIRRSPPLAEVPVVLVTSLGSEEDRRRGVEAGADAYLVKAEFSADLLLDTVARFA